MIGGARGFFIAVLAESPGRLPVASRLQEPMNRLLQEASTPAGRLPERIPARPVQFQARRGGVRRQAERWGEECLRPFRLESWVPGPGRLA